MNESMNVSEYAMYDHVYYDCIHVLMLNSTN